MGDSFLIAFIMVIIGGIMEGSFSLPLKYTPKWEWENIWGMGSLLALILIPWPLAYLTIPNLSEVLATSSDLSIFLAILFGAGWGIGSIFFGKGIDAVGFSFGYTIIMSLTAVGGSVVPLLMNNPEQILEPSGMVLLGGIGLMILGLVITSKAGHIKAQELSTEDKIKDSESDIPFTKGLLYCILAGLFSALVNFGLIYGADISLQAKMMGASSGNASNAIWALVFTANYLVNVVYCLYLTSKNGSYSNFYKKGTGIYWFWALLMGILWPGGIVVYGMGAVEIGELGAIFGFPVMIVSSIIAGNLWGIVNNEWRGTTTRPRKVMLVGVMLLVVAVFVLGISSNLIA